MYITSHKSSRVKSSQVNLTQVDFYSRKSRLPSINLRRYHLNPRKPPYLPTISSLSFLSSLSSSHVPKPPSPPPAQLLRFHITVFPPISSRTPCQKKNNQFKPKREVTPSLAKNSVKKIEWGEVESTEVDFCEKEGQRA